jgi:hypothetical protein
MAPAGGVCKDGLTIRRRRVVAGTEEVGGAEKNEKSRKNKSVGPIFCCSSFRSFVSFGK